MNLTTKFALMTALITGGPLALAGKPLKVVNQVQREDGSGKCFNVSGYDNDGKPAIVFVRTLD